MIKKYLQIHSLFLLFVFIVACKGQNGGERSEEGISQVASDSLESISTITDFDVISTPNAPTRITRKIRQDKAGNLLMAAFEDIIRYDGQSFVNFTKDAGLDSCDAFDVLEDTRGNIWIASTHLGVFRYDGKSFSQFRRKDGLAHNRTMCLYEDRAGNIWIGSEGGVSRYDGKSFHNFTTKDGLTDDDVNTIMEDRTGKIWIGTRGTACVYDPSRSTFAEITNDEGMPFGNVWSIIEDRKGNIWLSSGGLWRYDGNSFTHLTSESGICIYEDSKGNIWFNHSPPGPYKSVLSRYDAKSLIKELPMASQIFKGNGAFLGICEDREGNIWVGGDDGVWRYNEKAVNYFTGK